MKKLIPLFLLLTLCACGAEAEMQTPNLYDDVQQIGEFNKDDYPTASKSPSLSGEHKGTGDIDAPNDLLGAEGYDDGTTKWEGSAEVMATSDGWGTYALTYEGKQYPVIVPSSGQLGDAAFWIESADDYHVNFYYAPDLAGDFVLFSCSVQDTAGTNGNGAFYYKYSDGKSLRVTYSSESADGQYVGAVANLLALQYGVEV